MSRLSRQKGKRGEREFAALLRAHGLEARRGVQYRGGPDSPDVVCEALPIHWEVKRTEQLALYPALEQARTECPDGHTPVVATKRNRGRWIVLLDAEDLLRLLRARA